MTKKSVNLSNIKKKRYNACIYTSSSNEVVLTSAEVQAPEVGGDFELGLINAR